MIQRGVYEWLDGWAPFLACWVAACTGVTSARILLNRSRGVEKVGHSAFMTELPGLPLVLLQLGGFIRSAAARDPLSCLLFLWWGPGFWLTVAYLVWCKRRGRPPGWGPYKTAISWACKLNYLAFAVVFWALGLPAMVYVYSVWILNDQYGMAFLSLDADRLRRTFHDYWLIRVLYPAGLFVPLVHAGMPHRFAFGAYGAALFALWAAGILRVRRRGDILRLPDDPTLFRNMMYFDRPAGGRADGPRPA